MAKPVRSPCLLFLIVIPCHINSFLPSVLVVYVERKKTLKHHNPITRWQQTDSLGILKILHNIHVYRIYTTETKTLLQWPNNNPTLHSLIWTLYTHLRVLEARNCLDYCSIYSARNYLTTTQSVTFNFIFNDSCSLKLKTCGGTHTGGPTSRVQ